MYQDFFSLTTKPFSISPDPDFLFLSARHKEAIAHLQHGLQGYGGFALLTGEVGTGKTTICRSLVEEMGSNTDIAFILNPALNEIELLTTICDGFNVDYQNDNLEYLFNQLTNWLITNHLQSRHAIVLIDEAQHLSYEALEQLRLLTNIETDGKKLLQVILIGQTELQEKLKKEEFRQLAQSITARYHLLSLTKQESNFYIQHRLNIAGSSHAIFDKSALQEIFTTCGGIPRLTNILCDRALLAAYTQDSHIVTLKMVKQAIKEVHFNHQETNKRFFRIHWKLITLVLLATFTLLQAPQILQFFESEKPLHKSVAPLSFNNLNATASKKLNSQWLDAYPQLDLTNTTYRSALSSLYSIWGYQVNSNSANCRQGKVALLSCYTENINLEKLKQLNYPAIVQLEKSHGTIVHAVVYQISEQYKLLIDGYLIEVSEEWFKKYWRGETTLLWQAPFPLKGVLKFGMQGEKITWLANQLNKQQGWPTENKTKFDLRLLDQVSSFQRKKGLIDDGIAGPKTLMQLATPNSPRLMQETN